MTDEEYVRARWERVIVCDGSYRHYAKGTILLNWANHQFYEFNDWSAARAFTEQREREIAEVEKEIVLIENAMKIHRHNVSVGRKVCQHVKAICRWSRILSREQGVLAELRGGMKEGSE